MPLLRRPGSPRVLKAQPRNTTPSKRRRGTELNRLDDRPPAMRLGQRKGQPRRSTPLRQRGTAMQSFLRFAPKASRRFPSFPNPPESLTNTNERRGEEDAA